MEIIQHDSVYVKLKCSHRVDDEIYDEFSFEIPQAKYHPSVKSGWWDGVIRLFDIKTGLIYAGLVNRIVEFCETKGHAVTKSLFFDDINFTEEEAIAFCDSLNLPHEVRDYQLHSFIQCVRGGRISTLLPTASGKSLVMYLLARYYDHKKTLIITTSTGLVHQMASDFVDYGCDEDEIYKIIAGESKTSNKRIVISTWHTIYKMDANFFDEYEVVIGDEIHLFTAKSLVGIMENMKTCEHRFGFTATLDGSKTSEYVINGLFGRIVQPTSIAKLIESKHISPLSINAITLLYSPEERKKHHDDDWSEEISFLVDHPIRNKFIVNLAKSLSGNTIVLFRLVGKQGHGLYKSLCKIIEGRNVYFIHGGVDGVDRDFIRSEMDGENNAIYVASYGTFSTGVNTKNIANIIFASPYKSQVKVLQSIGRGLRLSEGKVQCKLFDISDDLSHNNKRNHTLKHFIQRISLYNRENLDYKTYNVRLKYE